MKFHKEKTQSWIKQKYIYGNEDGFYFLHSRNKNKITTSLVCTAIRCGLFNATNLKYLKSLRFNIVLVARTNIITTNSDYIAIGVVIENKVHIFVRSKYRRQGVGSSIIEFLKMKKVF